MTARSAAAASSRVLAVTLAGIVVLTGCTGFYEIPIETPIQPKMDVSPFQRVLVAGFIGGGSEDVDANLETVRLLRSQLRTKSGLRVIDADVLPLLELAAEQRNETPESAPAPATPPPSGAPGNDADAPQAGPSQPPVQDPVDPQTPRIRDEKDLERLESIFAD